MVIEGHTLQLFPGIENKQVTKSYLFIVPVHMVVKLLQDSDSSI